MRPAAVELLLSLTLLLPTAGARAEAPTRDQARCVRAMSEALVKLTGDLADQSVACLDDHADDDFEGSLEECLLANPAKALKDADTDPAQIFARRCADKPPFGITDPQSVSFAAVQGVSRSLRDAFGPNFDHALKKDDDSDLSECQISVAKEVLECQEARLEAFARCQKKGLRKDIESAEDLEECIGADPSGRMARKCELADELADCRDDGVSLATAFPGIDRSSRSATEVRLTQITDCRSCLAINTASGLSANCDRKDDGIANGSCEAFTCNAHALKFPISPNPNRKAHIELADGGVLQLNCPIVPNPTPTDNLPADYLAHHNINSPEFGMDHFAWNTFIAMNWPAMGPSGGGGTTRGIPDMTRSFKDAQYDDVTVWETLKEKREVFYLGSCTKNKNRACSHPKECKATDLFPDQGTCDLTKPPGQPHGRTQASLMWNGPLQYNQQGDPIRADRCKGKGAKDDPMPPRIFTSSTKLHFDSLDETLEVQSEALESVAELCKGHGVDVATECKGHATDPTCCTIRGTAVGPRVWAGDPADGGNPVFYEVKVNYDYFDFVTEAVTPNHICELGGNHGASCFPGLLPNGKPDPTCAVTDPEKGDNVRGTCTGTLGKYYIDTEALKAARPEKFNSSLTGKLARPSFLLPYRTNALPNPCIGGACGAPHNKAAKRGYDAQTCFINHGYGPESEVPCRIGSVHLKAAWLLLPDEHEIQKKYHTAYASYFKSAKDEGKPEEICRTSGTFGLIGLHIIQRTHNVWPPGVGTCNQPKGMSDVAGPRHKLTCDVKESGIGGVSRCIKSYPGGPNGGTCESPGFSQIGGTYIFATWEHAATDELDFRYANYDFRTADYYPTKAEALTLKREAHLGVPGQAKALAATEKVNDEVWGTQGLDCTPGGAEGDSVWCNYRLIGTQFKHVNIHEDDADFPIGQQQYFLANLVLESNKGLQKFQGQPPKTHPINWFKRHNPGTKIHDNFEGLCSDKVHDPTGITPEDVAEALHEDTCLYNPVSRPAANIKCGGGPDHVNMGRCSANSPKKHQECKTDEYCNPKPAIGNKCVKPYCVIPFAKTKNNIAATGKQGKNMGGCMGCHGIAQLNGYTFSFVSQDGQRGAGIDTETPGQFEAAPTPLAELPQ